MFKSKFWYLTLVVLVLASFALAACQPTTEEPAAEEPATEEPAAEEPAAEEMGGKVEIFSWWTAGGEAEGLGAMFDIYSAHYPDVEIVNATVAGGAGTNAKSRSGYPSSGRRSSRFFPGTCGVSRLKNMSLRPTCSRSKISTISLCSQRIS